MAFPIATSGITRERKPSKGASDGQIMNCAVELIGPCGVGEDSLDPEFDLFRCLLRTDTGGKASDDFASPQGQILGAVIKYLCAIVRRGFGPTRDLARSFHRIPNIFAIAERSFAKQAALRRTYLHAVARVRASLFAPDIKLDCAIDRWRARIRSAVDFVVFEFLSRAGFRGR